MNNVIQLKDYRKSSDKKPNDILTPELRESMMKIRRLMSEIKKLADKETP